MEKRTYQGTWIQTHHRQTQNRTNLICRMIAIPVNQIKRNVIRRKSVGNTINRTLQAHRRAILIRLITVITDASNIKIRVVEKKSDQIMRTFNGKVAEDSI